MAYYSRWVVRRDPFPEHVMSSFMNVREDVYGAMQGPEWNVTGHLKDWNVTDRLGELDLPVLVTSGRHDEMTSTLVQPLDQHVQSRCARPPRQVAQRELWTAWLDCLH